jgi:peptide methionine sulfoxide reductase MsrB
MRGKTLTIEEMKILAQERGGRCLSHEYVNNKTKLLWECAEGHQWEAKANHIKGGRWCPVCAGIEKLTLQEMQALAQKHGGKCLSHEYVNARTPLLWECAKGHQWKAKPTSIKNHGYWCSACAGVKKLTLQEMQMLAQEHGGKCLSHEYVNNKTKLLWECAKGHQWETTPNHVRVGQWCPICANVRRSNYRKLKVKKEQEHIA